MDDLIDFQMLAQNVDQTKSKFAELTEKLVDAKTGFGDLSGAAVEATVGIGKLGEAFVTGDFSDAPQTILSVVGAIGQVNPVAGIAAAGVGLIGGAILGVVQNAIQLHSSLQSIQNASLNMGLGGVYDAKAMEAEVKKLGDSYGVSAKDAGVFMSAMENIPKATDDTRVKMGELAAAYSKLNGIDPSKGADLFAGIAAGGAPAILQLDEQLGILTKEQRARLETGDASKDIYKAQEIAIEALNNRYKPYLEYMKQEQEYKQNMKTFGLNNAGILGPAVGLPVPTPPDIPKTGDRKDAAKVGTSLEDVRKEDEALKQQTDLTNSQILAKEVALWQKEADTWDDGSKKKQEYLAQAGAYEAQLRVQQGAEEMRDAQQQIAQMVAAKRLQGTQLLQAEEDTWKKLLDEKKVTGEQAKQVEANIHLIEAQMARTAGQEQVKQVQDTGAKIIQLQRQNAQEATQLRAQIAQQDKTAQEQRVQSQTTEINDEIGLLDRQLAEGVKNDQALVDSKQISADQQKVIERTRADEVYRLEMELLDKELALLPKGTTAYQAAADKRVEIEKKLKADLEAIDAGGKPGGKPGDKPTGGKGGCPPVNPKGDADEYNKAWNSAFKPVETGFNNMIGSMMKGNTSFVKAARQAATQWLQQEVQADAQWLVHKLLVNAHVLADDQATNQGGLLSFLVTNTGKTAAHVEGEAAKTAATDAGTAERTGVETAAAAESLAISAATGIKDIAIKAAQAAAGAYSAIAAIPYVGPFLAPAVAGGILAAVVALGSRIASAEGGWGQVPGDQIAQLHKDEMVLPAAIASPLRQALRTAPGMRAGLASGGGSLASAAGGGGISHSGDINLSIMAPPSAMTGMSPNEAQRWVAQQIQGGVRQAYLRMAPA